MPDEILDHGQELTLRARRGADFALSITLTDDLDVPINLTGAVIVGRIFAAGQPDVLISGSVDGPAGKLTISVSAARTKQMVPDWRYVLGYTLSGSTKAILFGNFFVSQEFI